MPSYFRFDGFCITPVGLAVAGAQVAVLSQPASFATQPGSPLQAIYAANASNSLTVTNAVWNGGQITFTFSGSLTADLVAGSYIGVSGVTPTGYNSTLSAPWLVVSINASMNQATVASLNNPGTYVSGGTASTSLLPNPTTADNNGNFFFYATSGIYSVQIYGPAGNTAALTERDLLDQSVGASGSSGSVSSVALSLPAQFSVTGSPITSSGTLTATWVNENANAVFIGPSTGAPAAPTFRALVAADLPAVSISQVTLTGAADALTFPSNSWVTTAGVDAMTLSTPVVTTDDGKIVFVTDVSGNAHTITTASNKIVPSHHVATFNGTIGSYVALRAYQGLWYVFALSGVTIS